MQMLANNPNSAGLQQSPKMVLSGLAPRSSKLFRVRASQSGDRADVNPAVFNSQTVMKHVPDTEWRSSSMNNIPIEADAVVTPLRINNVKMTASTDIQQNHQETGASNLRIRRRFLKQPYSPQSYSSELKLPKHSKRQAFDALLASYKQTAYVQKRQPKNKVLSGEVVNASLVWQLTPELLQRIRKYHNR